MQVEAQTDLAAAAQTDIGSGSEKRLTNCILFHGYESANFRFFTSFKIES
jgi:hypothetical protein